MKFRNKNKMVFGFNISICRLNELLIKSFWKGLVTRKLGAGKSLLIFIEFKIYIIRVWQFLSVKVLDFEHSEDYRDSRLIQYDCVFSS